MSTLSIPTAPVAWDLVALGEVMLRFDPGAMRIHTARTFRVWEGGAEYNVARNLRRCFGLRTTVVTALADNAVGRLIEGLILEGGVDTSHLRWIPFDGVGRSVRNGLNFTERGFGVREGTSCLDRGHTAASQLRPGEIDWDAIFGAEGARWFHCGGVFAALSETTPLVAEEAMTAARRHGAVVSYDLNVRSALWSANGGMGRAREVNVALAGAADVLFGNLDHLSTALGVDVSGLDPGRGAGRPDPEILAGVLRGVAERYPNLKLIGLTLRTVRSATRHDWGGACYAASQLVVAEPRLGLEVYDRVGAGDAFAAGLIYGLLSGRPLELALSYGVAHGALAMTTPGDTSMATLADVERLVADAAPPRVIRWP
jgi:2-dehydro-3-deoxygluconokinase